MAPRLVRPDLAYMPSFVAALREALSNAAKHAKARTAEVLVQLENDDVVLVVTDDGVGVPTTGGGRRSGITNLLVRAQALGGSCLVERAADGGGTRLTWRAPVR